MIARSPADPTRQPSPGGIDQKTQRRAASDWWTVILAILALTGSTAVFFYWTALDEATKPLYTTAAPRGLQSLTLFSNRQKAQQILEEWKKTTLADVANARAIEAAKEQSSPIWDHAAQLKKNISAR